MANNQENAKRILRVRVVFPDVRSLPDLTPLGPIDWAGRGPRVREGGRAVGEAYLTPEQLAALQQIGNCETEVIEDATEVGRQRQGEVGKGDRYRGGRRVPRGLGKKN